MRLPNRRYLVCFTNRHVLCFSNSQLSCFNNRCIDPETNVAIYLKASGLYVCGLGEEARQGQAGGAVAVGIQLAGDDEPLGHQVLVLLEAGRDSAGQGHMIHVTNTIANSSLTCCAFLSGQSLPIWVLVWPIPHGAYDPIASNLDFLTQSCLVPYATL